MRPISFAEMVRTVWRWLTGYRPKPSLYDQIRERRLIERLADELDEEDAKGERG
jgi:hypothetical protein